MNLLSRVILVGTWCFSLRNDSIAEPPKIQRLWAHPPDLLKGKVATRTCKLFWYIPRSSSAFRVRHIWFTAKVLVVDSLSRTPFKEHNVLFCRRRLHEHTYIRVVFEYVRVIYGRRSSLSRRLPHLPMGSIDSSPSRSHHTKPKPRRSSSTLVSLHEQYFYRLHTRLYPRRFESTWLHAYNGLGFCQCPSNSTLYPQNWMASTPGSCFATLLRWHLPSTTP